MAEHGTISLAKVPWRPLLVDPLARLVCGDRVAVVEGRLIVWRAVCDLVVFVSGEDDEIARKSRGRERPSAFDLVWSRRVRPR